MTGERPRSIYLPPWRVDLTDSSRRPPLVSGRSISRLVASALDAAGAEAPASIGVILADDAALAALNEQHMGHEGPTDVLSFPLHPPEAFPPHPGRPAPARGINADPAGGRAFPLPPGLRRHLGDLVVSVERAIEQAAEGRGGQTGDVRWAASDELRLLVVHGVLHVCGWDHAELEEAAAMRALETALLARPI